MVYGLIDQTNLLALSNLHGFGKKTVIKILNELESKMADNPYTTVESLSDMLKDLEPKMNNPHFKTPTITELEVAYNRSKEIIERSKKLGIKIICYRDADYPEKFVDIEDPPAVLYVKGNADCLNDNFCIAVVGTRHPTEYGEDAAFKMGSLFAKKGISVVGGLAEGCDTAAHRGCLKSNGRTIAVLAHGLDRVYPAQNKKLAEEIILKNGCLISEYPPGEPANKGNFIQRDRLQSALSAGVIVIETDIAGGTMHTVYYCLRQDRMLGCIKHPSSYERQAQSRGNELILKAYSEPHLYQQLKSHLDADRKTLDLIFEKRGLILPIDLDDLNTLEDFIVKSKSNFGISKVTKKTLSTVSFVFFEEEKSKPPSAIERDNLHMKNEDELNKQILVKKFSKYKVAELKQLLKDHGIKAKGIKKKNDLIFALLDGLPREKLMSLASNLSMLDDFFKDI